MKKFSLLLITSILMMCSAYLNLLSAQEDSNDKKPIDCISELMSRPSCINRLNATNACKMFGASAEAVSMIQKCVANQGFNVNSGIVAPPNIMAICLAGVSGSSKVSDNETFCKVGDTTKPIGISDSKMPKVIDSNSNNPTTSSSVNTSK